MVVRAFLLSLALVTVGCGGGGKESIPEPATTQSTTTRSMPAERFGFIRSVSTAGPAATLAFDEAELLTGKAAQKAAEDDGVVEPGEAVPNDYYIRNREKTAQTLRIANDAAITAKRCPLCRKGRPGELEPFLAAFAQGRQTYADPYRGKHALYWLTIEDGEVVGIDEQYVP